jgi:hypothetical protein
MPLIGTISGSNGSSNTAISGTLVIANTSTEFPTIASDAVLFVSGTIGGASKAVVGGDLVVSGTVRSITGFSGSLTRLADGSPYLVGGSGVTLSSGSSGAITISATSATNPLNDGGNKLNTTSSLALAGGLGSSYYASNAGTDVFFFVSGSTGGSDKAVFGGTVHLSGSLTGSSMLLTSTATSVLRVVGSGSSQPIFSTVGSLGELFTVTDSLTGSLFSVNDVSGFPILEVFSDSTTVVGDYFSPMFLATKKITSSVGNNTIYSIPTASYDAMFCDYTIKSGSNVRAGQISATYSGLTPVMTETSTTDLGDTSGVTFGVTITGGNMILTGSTSTASWSIKTIVRAI